MQKTKDRVANTLVVHQRQPDRSETRRSSSTMWCTSRDDATPRCRDLGTPGSNACPLTLQRVQWGVLQAQHIDNVVDLPAV